MVAKINNENFHPNNHETEMLKLGFESMTKRKSEDEPDKNKKRRQGNYYQTLV